MNGRLWMINDWERRAQEAKYCVKELARQCEVPLQTLRRFWRKRFGQCPKEWLLELRMRHARSRLEQGLQVKQVADGLGYGSRCHFARDFAVHHGYPPSVHVQRVMGFGNIPASPEG